jgi:hypothetical protein
VLINQAHRWRIGSFHMPWSLHLKLFSKSLGNLNCLESLAFVGASYDGFPSASFPILRAFQNAPNLQTISTLEPILAPMYDLPWAQIRSLHFMNAFPVDWIQLLDSSRIPSLTTLSFVNQNFGETDPVLAFPGLRELSITDIPERFTFPNLEVLCISLSKSVQNITNVLGRCGCTLHTLHLDDWPPSSGTISSV